MKIIEWTIFSISMIAFVVFLIFVINMLAYPQTWYYPWHGFNTYWKYGFTERPDYPVIATSFCIWIGGLVLTLYIRFLLNTLALILAGAIALISHFYYHPSLEKIGKKLIKTVGN